MYLVGMLRFREYQFVHGVAAAGVLFCLSPAGFPFHWCCVLCLVAQSCPTLCDPRDCSPPGSSRNFPGKKAGVGTHALLQGIFLTQGLNPGLLRCRQILYHLSHQGSPQIRKLMLNLPKVTQLASDELGFNLKILCLFPMIVPCLFNPTILQ